ncbi:MAG: hypothetical protein CMM28_11595 [Rhodospirillaceae bacterium]|nr:hypothetical protein [Rhodospirillaceae bacterium]
MMKSKKNYALILGLVLVVFFPASANAGNPYKGKWYFSKKCSFCHDVDLQMRSDVGPHLRTVIGRPIASVKEIQYSPHLQLLAKHGVKWDTELLTAFARKRDDAWFKPFRVKYLGSKCPGPRAIEKYPACAPYVVHSKRRPVRPDDLEDIISYLKAFVR